MLDNIFATQIIEAIIPVILIYEFYKRNNILLGIV